MSNRSMEIREFSQFKYTLSELYDGRKKRWLRFCLFDQLAGGDLTRENIPGTELFNKLEEHGIITYTNIKILAEIVELTAVLEAKILIIEYKRDKEMEEPERDILTPYRKNLFKAVKGVDEKLELPKMIAYYKLDHKEYTNIWDVVFYLERQNLLDESKEKVNIFACLLSGKEKKKFIESMQFDTADGQEMEKMELQYNLEEIH